MSSAALRVSFLAVACLVVALLVAARPVLAQDAIWAQERSIGNADAPVTVVEYFSLTCGHCGDFHRNVLPELTAKYVDTGKIRFVFRDFPLDNVAYYAAIVSRCFEGEGYHRYIKALFEKQEEWLAAPIPEVAASHLAENEGLSQEEIAACLGDRELGTWVLQSRQDAIEKFDVGSTPSFLIDGRIYSGVPSIAQFGEIVAPLLN